MSRRRLVVGVSALGPASMLAACDARGTGQAPQVSAKPIKLELSTDWNTPQRKAVLDTMKAEFTKQHPNVTIEHQHVTAAGGSAEGYTEKVFAQISAGTVSDVVANWAFAPFVDALADLTKDAPAAGWKKADVYYNPFHQEVSGKLYMLAMSASLSGWIYNKTLFQEAGLKEPDDTWTVDTVLDAARRLTRPDRQQYGVLATEAVWTGWLNFVWAAGAALTSPTTAEGFSAERKKTRLLEAGGADAFEWYVNLIQRHQVSPTPAQAREQGVTFAAGKVAMQPFQIYQSGSLAQQIGSNFVWSAMLQPKYPPNGKRASELISEGFVIPKVTKQRGSYETALRYTLSFYGDPVMKMVAEQRGTLPVVRKWFQSPEYLNAPPLGLDANVKTINDKDMIRGEPNFYHKQFRFWLAALRGEVAKAFSGENAPKPALTAAVAAADQVLAAG